MKHIFLQTSIFFFTILTFQTTAQVTITQDNYPRLTEFLDSGRIILNPGIPVPSGGPDQIWDYSSFQEGNFASDLYVDATNDSDFPDALNYFQSDLGFSIGAFSYDVPSNIYDAIDENGWYRTGRSFESLSIPLTAITGGADDRIDYLQGPSDYVGRLDIIKFPITYQNQWEGTFYFDLNYEVTAGAFGLNQTPAFTRLYTTNEREVIGHGLLTIPKSDGSPSEPMDVLLVKVNATFIDSIYLAGSPAPQALLDVLGVTQGAVSVNNFYVFYKPGFGAPVALFDFLENGQVGRAVYRPQAADFNTAIQDLNLANVQSFPNPVSSGSSISLSIEQLTSSGSICFFDLQGHLLHTVAFDSTSDNQLRVNIPKVIGTGMFVYQVLDKSNSPLGLGKLHVF